MPDEKDPEEKVREAKPFWKLMNLVDDLTDEQQKATPHTHRHRPFVHRKEIWCEGCDLVTKLPKEWL